MRYCGEVGAVARAGRGGQGIEFKGECKEPVSLRVGTKDFITRESIVGRMLWTACAGRCSVDC